MLLLCLGHEVIMGKVEKMDKIEKIEKNKKSVKLTAKQQLVLDYISEFTRKFDYPPTIREIGDNFGITVKGAYDHIKAIEKKGFLKIEGNKSRAIVINRSLSSSPDSKIPLLGRIAAGVPITAEENIEDYISLPDGMVKSGVHFALKVQGDSMIEAGIANGDIAVIKQQNVADNGDIIAALVDGEATLKQLKFSGKKPVLVPKNKAYKPITPDDLIILGKLAGIFRSY